VSELKAMAPSSGRVAEPLRNRDFLLLWTGQTLSAVGDPVFPVAIAFLVMDRHLGVAGLGAVFAARSFAVVLAVLFGGVLADRLKRKHVMIGADLLRAGALLGIVLLANSAGSALVSMFAFVIGLGEAMFRPAYSALVPTLLPAAHLQMANSLTSVSSRTAAFVGPALAGVLVAVVGPRTSLAIDAVTFLASVLTLWKVAERSGPAGTVGQSILAQAREGVRVILRRRWVAIEIGVSALQVGLSLAPWLVLLPVIASGWLGGESAYGTLLTAMGGGALIGALVAGRLRVRGTGVVACLSLLPFSLALTALAVHAPLPVLVVLHVVAGMGVEIYGVLWVSAVQLEFEPAVLGRVFAVDELGSKVLLPLGMVVVAALADARTSTVVLIVAAVVNVLTSVLPLVLRDVRIFASSTPVAAKS
jgi:MFS family permease